MAAMNSPQRALPEELALREIEQGTVRLDLWERALSTSQGNKSLAKTTYIRMRTESIQADLGKMLAKHVRSALAKDANRPADFKSARDLGKK
jgi:hypothetical protein